MEREGSGSKHFLSQRKSAEELKELKSRLSNYIDKKKDLKLKEQVNNPHTCFICQVKFSFFNKKFHWYPSYLAISAPSQSAKTTPTSSKRQTPAFSKKSATSATKKPFSNGYTTRTKSTNAKCTNRNKSYNRKTSTF
jgi:hypothetical protein